MVAGLVKMGVFDLDLIEHLKNAEESTDLNKVIKDIVKEANYQLIDEEVHKYNINWSIINHQVVGAEVN